jgi:N-hydroxyarylamine O-acetyltransferase
MSSLDLDAYLDRVRWTGSLRCAFDTLTGLLHAHMASIPFENFDVLLGRPILLDLAHLQEKLVSSGRGGYCFEQTTLFAAVLEKLGFSPLLHSARVILFSPRTVVARSHMFLTVEVESTRYVIDPGFGLLAPRYPIPLVDRADATVNGETQWMVRDGDYWVLRARRGDEIVSAWVSTLEADNPMDFEVANHFQATHQSSAFTSRLMLRALTGDGYVSAMNRDVTIWGKGGKQSMQLADRRALRDLVIEHFGFDLPEIERLRVPSIPEWE